LFGITHNLSTKILFVGELGGVDELLVNLVNVIILLPVIKLGELADGCVAEKAKLTVELFPSAKEQNPEGNVIFELSLEFTDAPEGVEDIFVIVPPSILTVVKNGKLPLVVSVTSQVN
tara:strand:- start:150 stop:503 length:354 start_codon:yes stop_codon:yes gene_type:complete